MKALATTLDPAAPMAIREVPDPILTAHRALVQVKAFSLNRGELASIARNGVGWIPGQDIAGTVLQAAADGSGPPVGSRVVALTDEFGWAELAAVEGHRMAVLPDNVGFEQACTLPVAGLTALRCVRLGGAIVGRRVAWGRFVNVGQTCIAPDYVLALPGVQDKLVAAIQVANREFFGTDPKKSPHYGRIVNSRTSRPPSPRVWGCPSGPGLARPRRKKETRQHAER